MNCALVLAPNGASATNSMNPIAFDARAAGMAGAAWFAAPGVVYGQTFVGIVVGVLAALWSWQFLRGFGAGALDAAKERP